MRKAYLKEFTEEEIDFAKRALIECATKLEEIGLVAEVFDYINLREAYQGYGYATFDIKDVYLTGALDKDEKAKVKVT